MSRLTWFALVAASLALAGPTLALDLTGTWQGKFVCTEYDGVQIKFKEDATLRVTQTGNDLAVDWVGEAILSGKSIADIRKPDQKGEASMVDCETDADMLGGYDELARLRAKVNRAKGTGSLKGESIYAPGGLQIGSCKWQFKLMDPADPAVLGCPG